MEELDRQDTDEPVRAHSQNETVTDSPAAQRRERRHTFQTEGNPTGSNPDPRTSGSAIRTRSNVAHSFTSLFRGPDVEASEQVLFVEDVRFMRTFSALIGCLCTALVIVVPFLGGDPILRAVLWGGSCFSIFTSLWVVFSLRDLERYDQTLINIMALLSILIAYAGVLFVGVFSPISLVILPAIYFFARTQDRTPALAMFLTCTTLQATLASLVISGVMVDPGLYTSGEASTLVKVATQATVLSMYGGTFLLARVGREVVLDAMRKLAAADRENKMREAAFLEVRQDLDRVLGAGGVGHYSDRRLGSYQIGGIIGRGAMGEVYEAVHKSTGQLAAAKVLHPHVLAKQSSVERFFREAQAASALQCEHSVQVFEFSSPDEPVPYIVMERLVGFDLSHHLRKRRRLPFAEVLTLVREVGTVIDLAASKGIVHRDLKPQNLFLHEQQGKQSWKVLDFGASKLAEHSGTLTQGRVIGTPSYMSPQQAKGQDVDSSADRYCLAAIVFRALTGRPPYSGKDLPTTLYNVVYSTPPQPSILADIDPMVDLVLAVGMAKNSNARFATAQEFTEALERAGRGEITPELEERALALLGEYPWGMLGERALSSEESG